MGTDGVGEEGGKGGGEGGREGKEGGGSFSNLNETSQKCSRIARL